MQPALIDAARSAMVRLYGTHPLESRVVLTAEEEEERKTFLISLFAFMIHRKTPIDKLLVIGGKNGEQRTFVLIRNRQINIEETCEHRQVSKQMNKFFSI